MNRREWMKGAAAGLLAGTARTTRAAGTARSLQSGSRRASEVPLTATWTPVHPGVWRARLGTPEPFTPVSSRMLPVAHGPLGELASVKTPPIAAPTWQADSRGCLVRLPLSPKEEIYGFGLQMLSFAQRGKKKTIRVNADPKADSGDAHAPVPFYVSTRGYGVLVDSCRQSEFFCGEARLRPGKLPKARAAAGGSSQESAAVTVEVPRAAGVDIYLFAGPSMLEAVKRYNLFSGGGIEPPVWGLGFWYRTDMPADQQQVSDLVHEFRERHIPCDVLGLEPGWQTHSYSCSFVWDKDRFPDPAGLLRDVTALNLRVNLWEHAFTHPSSPLYGPLLEHSGDFEVWGGLMPDFAGEIGSDIFADYHGKAFIDQGIAGFKLDECDNSDFTGGWSFPDFSQFPSGVDGEQMHAVFGLRYQHAIGQQFLKRKLPNFGLCRSTGALAAPYPYVLYSDLYNHREYVRALANSGFTGILWCPEVRDAESEEDLIRRLETVVFSPVAMVNGWYLKNPPWKQIDRDKNHADQFMPGWESLEAKCRTLLEWRMRLIPYLRGAFARYASDGTPPFRALILDYPEQEALRKVDDEYMVGDRMLVAPLFAGEDERKVILPQGAWHDFWTGKLVEGGQTLTIARTASQIPVFVKAGSVMPLATISDSTEAPESRQLTIQIYGDGKLPWRMEGESGFELQWKPDSHEVRVVAAGKKPHGYRILGFEQAGAAASKS